MVVSKAVGTIENSRTGNCSRSNSGSALEEDVVGDHDRSSAVDFQQRLDVLDEIELFVLGAL